MSLFNFGKRLLKKYVKPALGTIAGAVNPVLGAVVQAGQGMGGTVGSTPPYMQQAAFPVSAIGGALKALPRVLPGAGAIGGTIARTVGTVGRTGLRKWSARAIRAAGYVTSGYLVYDAAGNLIGEKARRHINPLNPKALNRAIRRVCSAKSISRKIESLTAGKPCRTRRRKC